MDLASTLMSTIQCGSGYRRDCIKGSKCKMWHIGEPTNKPNYKKTYSFRSGTVVSNGDDCAAISLNTSPRVEGTRRKRFTPSEADDSSQSINEMVNELSEDTQDTQESKQCCTQENFAQSTPDSSQGRAKITKYRINSLRPVYGPKNNCKTGLRNLGNTCFMNSIIQCLVNTNVLTDRLASLFNKNTNMKVKGMANELHYLSMIIRSKDFRSISPFDFKREFDASNPSFLRSRQHDAHEALINILDHVELELRQLDSNDKSIEDIFDGQMKRKITCTNTSCQDVAEPIDTFRYLHVEVPGNRRKARESGRKSLDKCIELEMRDEIMEEKRCKKCHDSTEARKTTTISKLPEILIIQLKRFSFDGLWSNKIHTPIDCPLELDMGKYTKDKQGLYQLYGMVDHCGGSSSGHYTATCKDPESRKTWYCYNDDQTSAGIDENDLSTKHAYILFYKKRREDIALEGQIGNIETVSGINVDDETTSPLLFETRKEGDEQESRPRRYKPSQKIRDNEEMKQFFIPGKKDKDKKVLCEQINHLTQSENEINLMPGNDDEKIKKRSCRGQEDLTKTAVDESVTNIAESTPDDVLYCICKKPYDETKPMFALQNMSRLVPWRLCKVQMLAMYK